MQAVLRFAGETFGESVSARASGPESERAQAARKRDAIHPQQTFSFSGTSARPGSSGHAYREAPASPTSTNGAQKAGCAS
jgi:hypothetical protein